MSHTETMPISPCIHPRCDRDNGAPQLTRNGMCDPCQHHYHRTIRALVLDWLYLRTTMPKPLQRELTSRHGTKVYGHPAEWASDTARDITDTLNDTHDDLADHLKDNPPPHPHTTETIRLRRAWAYLDPRIHALATYPGAADKATEINDLHQYVRRHLGYTRAVTRLPGVACLSCDIIGALTITEDQIRCAACSWEGDRNTFGLIARHHIDTLIDAYDQHHATNKLAEPA